MFWNLNRSFLATTYLRLLKEILSKSRLMFFYTLKHNLSRLMILVAIAWHEWIPVFLMQINSWKDTRRQLHSLLSFLWPKVTANQGKRTFVCFYWVLNNRWAPSNTTMNTTCSRSVLQMTSIIFLHWRVFMHLSFEVFVTMLWSPFCKANQWDYQQNPFLVLWIIIIIYCIFFL